MGTRSTVQTVYHGAMTLVYFFTIIEYHKLPLPYKSEKEKFAGCWKYLTFWNLIVQFLFFAFSFSINILNLRCAKFIDKFYAGLAMPYGSFVVIIFWGLFSIDRELVYPKTMDDVFPLWLNHTSHTTILPFLLLEAYITRHQYPKRKDGMKITIAFGLLYDVWVLYLGLAKGIWPYPIFYLLNWGQRAMFIGAALISSMLFYIIGEKINSCFWGDGSVAKSKTK